MQGGAGTYLVYTRDGKTQIGTIGRERHTYRTAYSGTRIGYDRSHYCWNGETPDWRKPRLRCYRTLADVAEIMLREWKEDNA